MKQIERNFVSERLFLSFQDLPNFPGCRFPSRIFQNSRHRLFSRINTGTSFKTFVKGGHHQLNLRCRWSLLGRFTHWAGLQIEEGERCRMHQRGFCPLAGRHQAPPATWCAGKKSPPAIRAPAMPMPNICPNSWPCSCPISPSYAQTLACLKKCPRTVFPPLKTKYHRENVNLRSSWHFANILHIKKWDTLTKKQILWCFL